MVGASLIREGDLAYAKGVLDRAHTLLHTGSKNPHGGAFADDAGLQRLRAVTLNNIACVHRREGDLDAAMDCLEEALAVDAALAARARSERSAGKVRGEIGANAAALLLNLSTVFAVCVCVCSVRRNYDAHAHIHAMHARTLARAHACMHIHTYTHTQVLGRWEEARCRAQHAIACVWSFETHWQNPQERMYTAVASYHNLALAQRALGMHALASTSISLSLSASINFFGGEGSLSKRVCSLWPLAPHRAPQTLHFPLRLIFTFRGRAFVVLSRSMYLPRAKNESDA